MKALFLLLPFVASTIALGKTPTKHFPDIGWERAVLAAERGEECAIFRRLEFKTTQKLASYEDALKSGTQDEDTHRDVLENCAHDNNIADWDGEPTLVLVAEVCNESLREFTLVGRKNTLNRRELQEAREQLQYVRAKLKQYCRPLPDAPRVSAN